MATKPQLKTVEKIIDENDAAATLAGAMSLAFAEIDAATKSATNPHFKSKYADLTSIIGSIKPALIARGLFFTQRCQPSQDGVEVETVLHHSSGEEMSLGTLYVPANKRDAQGFGSALTYARRYALQTAFGVPTEDDDGNAASRSTNEQRTPANPSTGEVPPEKRTTAPREKLADLELKDGTLVPAPYPFITHLMTATREFVRTLNSFGDLDEFIEWGKEDETQLFLRQLRRDLPGWWAGGDGAPEDWIPIDIQIAQRKRDLEQIASLKAPA